MVVISPQAWGCTEIGSSPSGVVMNLPTSVGMYRAALWTLLGAVKSPHKRGDVPDADSDRIPAIAISPQAWGCTVKDRAGTVAYANLPTSVGMYRLCAGDEVIEEKSPHKRGDVPCFTVNVPSVFLISPQAWGCTVMAYCTVADIENLPTSVGMYRPPVFRPVCIAESPHKRGDVPRRLPLMTRFA